MKEVSAIENCSACATKIVALCSEVTGGGELRRAAHRVSSFAAFPSMYRSASS